MPSLPPTVKGYLFYDGVWNDVSNKMSQTEPITIERGVGSEQDDAAPARASLKMDNRSGDFSPRNPNSPLFGKIGRNTPMRIAIQEGPSYLKIPQDGLFNDSYLTTPDVAALDFTGDVDIRLDGASRIWSRFDDGEALALAERWDFTGTNLCWFLAQHRTGHLYFAWSANGSTDVNDGHKSTEVLPFFNGERGAVRVTLDVNNGAGGYTVRFYYSNQIDGEWVELGAPVVTTGGTTSVFNGSGGAQVNVGASEGGSMPDGTGAMEQFYGKIYSFQMLQGINGPLMVDLDIARDFVTGTSLTDATGLVWTLNEDATFSNEYMRISGEVPSWPPTRDLSGNDRTTSIEPTGIMRRLDAGNKPLESALLRYLRNLSPIECWPLIDGVQSQGGASINGGQPAAFWERVGTSLFAVANQKYEWASGNIAGWIEPVGIAAEGVAGYLLCECREDLTANNSWAIDFFFTNCNDSIPEFEFTDRTLATDVDGTITWSMVLNRDTDALDLLFDTRTENAGSTALLEHILAPGIFDKQPHHIRLQVDPGATSDYFIYVDGVLLAAGTYPVPSMNLKQLKFNWFLDSEPFVGFPYGFITYWGSNYPVVTDVYNAFLGFPGDKTGARFDRLLDEQGLIIGSFTQGQSGGEIALQEEMGTQGLKKFVELLQQAASTDIGIMAEMRDEGNLYLRARSTLYNQAPRFTLDFSEGVISAPFKPLDDDKLTENDVIVKRINGSESRAIEETGRMSIQDPPDGVGRYDVSKDLSLFTDAQTADLAYWFLHMGTFDGLRYTRLTLNLANPRVYEMLAQILNTDLGDVIRITNLPKEYGPDDVDLIVRGYTEEIGPDAWKITFNCSPGETWTVAGVANDIYEGFEDANLDIEIANAGSANWARDTTTGHTGTSSFKSGTIANNQVSDAIVTVPNGAERIEFWFKTSSEAAGPGFDGDQLIVLKDGVEQMRSGGILDWALFGFDVAGASTVTFRYDKDNSGAVGSDAAWIDDVRFRMPSGPAVVVDSDTSYTTEAMTNTETNMDTSTTSPYPWITSAESYTDFPIEVRVGGEVMRVDSIEAGLFDNFTRTNPDIATDAFGRTVANAWGTADLGGAWTVAGGTSADFNVGAGVGTVSAGVVNSSRFTLLPGITNVDMEMKADNSVPVVATGASISTGLRMRQIDNNNYYYIEQIRATSGNTSIQLVSRIAGVSTVIAGPVSKGAYLGGQMWTIRARVVGNLLQAKLWLTSGSEPDLWDVEAITSTLPAANPAGTRTILSTGNTNTLPVVSSWDNISIKNITQGWGTATSGDSWATSGGNTYDYSVTDGEGMIAIPAVNSSRRVLTGPSWVDVDLKCNVQVPVVALTDSIDPGLLARYTSSSNYYLGTLHFHNDSTVDVRIRKVVGGTFTTIGISALLPGTYTAGSRYWMRFQVFGTQLKAKGWAFGTTEPSDWNITAVDTSLAPGGDVGVRANLQINNTNTLPVTLEFDDFEVLNPQQFNVTRSINGVVKSHAAGAKVELAQTPIVPL